MRRVWGIVGVTTCVLVAGSAGAAAQDVAGNNGVRSAPVTTVTSPITIDGALSEEAWRSSPTIGDLVQRQPNPGEAPSERTEVTLLRDADNLYIGVYAHDS